MTDAPLAQRESELWRALSLMASRLSGAMEQRLQREANISGPDFEILQALNESTHRQARARELGATLSWEKSRVSHQVSRMVSRGLVERVQCDTDQRGIWIALTHAGAETLDRATPAYTQVLRAHLTGLVSDADADALTRTARAVVTSTEPDCVANDDL